MNATDTATDAPAIVRTSAHADCDHPKTKVARAACRRARRSDWTIVLRGDVAKGTLIRVTTTDDQAEGTLLGWGEKRLTLRDADEARANFDAAKIVKVEIRKGADVDTDA